MNKEKPVKSEKENNRKEGRQRNWQKIRKRLGRAPMQVYGNYYPYTHWIQKEFIRI